MAFNKQKALDRAEKYAAKGQHDRAAREYQTVVDADPTDIRAWLMLADCLQRCGEVHEAIDRFLKVADHYADGQDYQKALAVYRQVVNLDASRFDVHLKIARLSQAVGRIPDAIATYEYVAQLQMQQGKTDEALRTLEMVAQADPTAVPKRLRVAELYSRAGQPEQAVGHFRMAADVLLGNNALQDYVKVAERLLYHDKEHIDTLRELAQIYLQLEQPKRALIKLNALLHASANDHVGLELLGETFVSLGKSDKAASVMLELARDHHARGDDGARDALKALRKGLQWAPGNADLEQAMRDFGHGAEADAELDMVTSGVEGFDLSSDNIQLTDDGPIEVEPEEVLELDEDDVELEELADLEELPADETPLTTSVMSEAEGGDEAEGSTEGDDVDKVLFEARTYAKYKLFEHAVGHLQGILDEFPDHVGALSQLAEAYDELERPQDAADIRVRVASALAASDPKGASDFLGRALEVKPHDTAALDVLRQLQAGAGGADAAPGASDEDGLDSAFDVEEGDLVEPSGAPADPPPFAEPDRLSHAPVDDRLEDPGGEQIPTLTLDDDDAAAFAELEQAADGTDPNIVRPGLDLSQAEPLSAPPGAPQEELEEDFSIDLAEPEPDEEEATEPINIEDRFGLGGDDEDDAEETTVATKAPQAPKDAAEPPTADAPSWPDISEDLGEVEFYLAQGLEDDAREALTDLQEEHGEHPDILALLARLTGEEPPPKAQGTPISEASESASRPLVDFGDDDDADAYLAAIFDAPSAAEPEPKKESTLRGRADVEDSDPATLFDLGTAYQEMGLVDDAIAQFEAAAQDPAWRAKSLVLIGALRLHRGETDDAIRLLEEAVGAAQTDDELREARYELALVYEKLGDIPAAISALEQVDPGFRDRDERLAGLR